MNVDTAYISEIFSSIQGEGALLGLKQIFIRFSICDLRCTWCDTPESLIKSDTCMVESSPGSRDFFKIPNPVSMELLKNYLLKLNPEQHHSISITGGEPLLQADFLLNFLRDVKENFNFKFSLETGGHRFDELKKIISLFDYVSMDIKLKSSSGVENTLEKHKKFLEICKHSSLEKYWIKVVITAHTLLEEIEEAIYMIKDTVGDDKVEIFIQPVTQINNINSPSERNILIIQEKINTIYPFVKVVPQMHALLGYK